jgi:hypothetical protein
MFLLGFLPCRTKPRHRLFARPVPFVTPGVAGQIDVIDQNHRSSGGVEAEPSS